MSLFRTAIDIKDIIAKMSERPVALGVEATNICNANCIFCGYQYLKRPKATLPVNLFKKAIDEFAALGGGDVSFAPTVGEPLMDPDFIEKIRYAKDKKNIKKTTFFTNGILINKIGARPIIGSGIDQIAVSIGGFDPQTYFRIFRVNHWHDVYIGIINLLKENELCHNRVNICIRLHSDIPIWRWIRTPAYAQLKRFRFGLMHNVFSDNIYYDNWGGLIKQESLSKAMPLRKCPKKIEPCLFLYTIPTILSNGDMTLCGCRDLNGDLVIGNIKDKSILEIWQDPAVKKIRHGFYASDYPKVCQDCSFYEDLSVFRKEKIKNLL
jgi:MoaA/NifB/PqqE/SkfB family radical SAM enzyme